MPAKAKRQSTASPTKHIHVSNGAGINSTSLSSIYEAQELQAARRSSYELSKKYEITEETIQALKDRGKSSLSENRTDAVNGRTQEQIKHDPTSLFLVNVILTTKVKRLQEENDQLKKRFTENEVSLEACKGSGIEHQHKRQAQHEKSTTTQE